MSISIEYKLEYEYIIRIKSCIGQNGLKSYLSYLTEVLLFNRKRFNKYLNVGKDTLILIFWRMLFQI